MLINNKIKKNICSKQNLPYSYIILSTQYSNYNPKVFLKLRIDYQSKFCVKLIHDQKYA